MKRLPSDVLALHMLTSSCRTNGSIPRFLLARTRARGFTPGSLISAPQNLIENADRDQVYLLGRHYVARSRDLLIRVPAQQECKCDARVVSGNCAR